MGPATILKSILSIDKLDNPTAEVLYAMLALGKHCSSDYAREVIECLEKAAKYAM